jgi:hypothetical protein
VEAQIQPEQISVNMLVDELYEGGYGFAEGRKPSDVVRLMGNNSNSLSLFDDSRSWKVDKIKEINQQYQTDGFLLQECGTDFCYLSEDQFFGARFGDSDWRFVATNNVTENTGRSQYGGVASLNFPRLAGFTFETGKDPTGLARWVYTYVEQVDAELRLSLPVVLSSHRGVFGGTANVDGTLFCLSTDGISGNTALATSLRTPSLLAI